KPRSPRGFHRRCVPSSPAGLLSALELPEKFRPGAGAHQPPDRAGRLRVDGSAGAAVSRRCPVRRTYRCDGRRISAALRLKPGSPRRCDPPPAVGQIGLLLFQTTKDAPLGDALRGEPKEIAMADEQAAQAKSAASDETDDGAPIARRNFLLGAGTAGAAGTAPPGPGQQADS